MPFNKRKIDKYIRRREPLFRYELPITPGLTMTNKKFNKLFGGPPRKSETKITQREMDLAASVQKVTEDIVIKLAKDIARETGERNLCLAGGVALNCVVNGILLRKRIFDKIWIQPAAGDAGGALGAALSFWYLNHNKDRQVSSKKDTMKGAYLGPKFSNDEIEIKLKECGAVYKKLTDTELLETVSDLLVNQKAVGWMQGRMEFGPRALGGRRYCRPTFTSNAKQLNLKVKIAEF